MAAEYHGVLCPLLGCVRGFKKFRMTGNSGWLLVIVVAMVGKLSQ